ncbi:hypothetical protein EVA_11606, partial [gut metagenome]
EVFLSHNGDTEQSLFFCATDFAEQNSVSVALNKAVF